MLLTVAASCCRLCLLAVCLSRSACPSVQLSALSALSAKRATATFFADNAVIKIQLQLKVRTQSAQTTNKAKGNAREPKGETETESDRTQRKRAKGTERQRNGRIGRQTDGLAHERTHLGAGRVEAAHCTNLSHRQHFAASLVNVLDTL